MIRMINRSDEFIKQLKINNLSVLNKLGEFLVSKMDYHVPVDTGYLYSRNTYKIENEILFLMNDCDYAIHQEFGTSKMKAQPFMRPSALNYQSDLKRITLDYLGKGMR